MTIQDLPIGAPFRFDGRNFYKGERVELGKFVPITSQYYRIYEVRERCLYLDEGLSLIETAEVESLLL